MCVCVESKSERGVPPLAACTFAVRGWAARAPYYAMRVWFARAWRVKSVMPSTVREREFG